jgi:hypothetical protein
MPYSDKKIKAKYAPEYSVLNPETSSDSDSLKSKGARWVSARVQINQKGKQNKKTGDAITTADRIEKENNKNLIKTIKVLKTDS